MPAIMIRQLDALTKIIEQTPDRARRKILLRQAEAIQRSNLATVADPTDRNDVTQRYEAVMALLSKNGRHHEALAGEGSPSKLSRVTNSGTGRRRNFVLGARAYPTAQRRR